MTPVADAPRTRRIGFDLLRILSICGVVAIHTFGPLAANPDLTGTASRIASLVLSTGFIWAVPVFVMLSGALTLDEGSHRQGPGPFYARRARRIVPALVVWTLVYLVIVRLVLLGEPLTFGTAIADIVEARVYPHLYFLWLIAGLYAVAPVLAGFLHGGGRRRANAFATIALGVTLLVVMAYSVLAAKGAAEPVHVGALTFWIPYVGYFLCGYALTRQQSSRVAVMLAAVGVIVFGAAALAQAAWPEDLAALRVVSTPDYLGVIVAALSVCVFVVGVALFDRVMLGPRATRVVVALSEASFGVFLVHLVVMLVPYQLLPGYHDRTSVLSGALAYVFVLVVSFAISLIARRVPGVRLVF